MRCATLYPRLELDHGRTVALLALVLLVALLAWLGLGVGLGMNRPHPAAVELDAGTDAGGHVP